MRRERVNEPRLAAKPRRILDAPVLALFTPPRHEENARRPAPVGARIFPTCPKGHIDYLNWRAFVHPGGRPCERPPWLEERGTSGDVVDTHAVCECGAERSLYEAAGVGTNALGQCAGKRPWIGHFAREDCNRPCRLLVRTASNACFPQTMSVISLPEFDARLADKVSQHRDRLKAADDLGALASFRRMPELAAAFAGVDDAAVVAEYRRQKDGGSAAERPVKDAEFEILDRSDARIGEDDPRSEFFAETLDRARWDPDGDPLLEGVGKLVLAHRLREVVALLGFTRFEAIGPDKDGEIDLDVERAALAETISWLPALRGSPARQPPVLERPRSAPSTTRLRRTPVGPCTAPPVTAAC